MSCFLGLRLFAVALILSLLMPGAHAQNPTANPSESATIKFGLEVPKPGTGLSLQGVQQTQVGVSQGPNSPGDIEVTTTTTRHLSVEILAAADGVISKQRLLVNSLTREIAEKRPTGPSPAPQTTSLPTAGRVYLIEKAGPEWKVTRTDGSAVTGSEFQAVRSHLRVLYRPNFTAWLRSRDFKIGETLSVPADAAREFADNEQNQTSMSITLKHVDGGMALFEGTTTVTQSTNGKVALTIQLTGKLLVPLASGMISESATTGTLEFAQPHAAGQPTTGKLMNGTKLTALAKAPEMKEISSVHDFSAKTIDGKDVKLADYAGKVLLIVNVASKCGYTKQYAGLQKLFHEFETKGFVILGFPCNEFGGQEPGSDSDIRDFCSKEYGVTFPMFSKVKVKMGPDQSPLFKFLGEATGQSPRWNFGKYVIGKDGKPVSFFDTTVPPDDPKLRAIIEQTLAK